MLVNPELPQARIISNCRSRGLMRLIQLRNTSQAMAWMRLWYWSLLPPAWPKAKLNAIMSSFVIVFCTCIHNYGTHDCHSNHRSYYANGIPGLHLWLATVIVIKNAIVLFYDQICDCECNNRKEIMLRMVNIFNTVNSLHEYSCKYTLT